MSDATAINPHGGIGSEPSHEHHEEHPKVPYAIIAITLFVMTGVTIAVSFWDLGKAGNVMLAMFIAAFKASLVMAFFMHLKYEKKTMLVIAAIPYVLAAILWLALFPDVVFGQYH